MGKTVVATGLLSFEGQQRRLFKPSNSADFFLSDLYEDIHELIVFDEFSKPFHERHKYLLNALLSGDKVSVDRKCRGYAVEMVWKKPIIICSNPPLWNAPDES